MGSQITRHYKINAGGSAPSNKSELSNLLSIHMQFSASGSKNRDLESGELRYNNQESRSFKSNNLSNKTVLKKLTILPSKFTKSVTMDRNLKSAVTLEQNRKVMSLQKFKSFKSVGQSYYNKKVADTFDFKDLKEITKSEEQENSKSSKSHKLEGRSLFIFSSNNKLRSWVNRIVSHAWFEYAVIVVILIS